MGTRDDSAHQHKIKSGAAPAPPHTVRLFSRSLAGTGARPRHLAHIRDSGPTDDQDDNSSTHSNRASSPTTSNPGGDIERVKETISTSNSTRTLRCSEENQTQKSSLDGCDSSRGRSGTDQKRSVKEEKTDNYRQKKSDASKSKDTKTRPQSGGKSDTTHSRSSVESGVDSCARDLKKVELADKPDDRNRHSADKSDRKKSSREEHSTRESDRRDTGRSDRNPRQRKETPGIVKESQSKKSFDDSKPKKSFEDSKAKKSFEESKPKKSFDSPADHQSSPSTDHPKSGKSDESAKGQGDRQSGKSKSKRSSKNRRRNKSGEPSSGTTGLAANQESVSKNTTHRTDGRTPPTGKEAQNPERISPGVKTSDSHSSSPQDSSSYHSPLAPQPRSPAKQCPESGPQSPNKKSFKPGRQNDARGPKFEAGNQRERKTSSSEEKRTKPSGTHKRSFRNQRKPWAEVESSPEEFAKNRIFKGRQKSDSKAKSEDFDDVVGGFENLNVDGVPKETIVFDSQIDRHYVVTDWPDTEEWPDCCAVRAGPLGAEKSDDERTEAVGEEDSEPIPVMEPPKAPVSRTNLGRGRGRRPQHEMFSNNNNPSSDQKSSMKRPSDSESEHMPESRRFCGQDRGCRSAKYEPHQMSDCADDFTNTPEMTMIKTQSPNQIAMESGSVPQGPARSVPQQATPPIDVWARRTPSPYSGSSASSLYTTPPETGRPKWAPGWQDMAPTEQDEILEEEPFGEYDNYGQKSDGNYQQSPGGGANTRPSLLGSPPVPEHQPRVPGRGRSRTTPPEQHRPPGPPHNYHGDHHIGQYNDSPDGRSIDQQSVESGVGVSPNLAQSTYRFEGNQEGQVEERTSLLKAYNLERPKFAGDQMPCSESENRTNFGPNQGQANRFEAPPNQCSGYQGEQGEALRWGPMAQRAQGPVPVSEHRGPPQHYQHQQQPVRHQDPQQYARHPGPQMPYRPQQMDQQHPHQSHAGRYGAPVDYRAPYPPVAQDPRSQPPQNHPYPAQEAHHQQQQYRESQQDEDFERQLAHQEAEYRHQRQQDRQSWQGESVYQDDGQYVYYVSPDSYGEQHYVQQWYGGQRGRSPQRGQGPYRGPSPNRGPSPHRGGSFQRGPSPAFPPDHVVFKPPPPPPDRPSPQPPSPNASYSPHLDWYRPSGHYNASPQSYSQRPVYRHPSPQQWRGPPPPPPQAPPPPPPEPPQTVPPTAVSKPPIVTVRAACGRGRGRVVRNTDNAQTMKPGNQLQPPTQPPLANTNESYNNTENLNIRTADVSAQRPTGQIPQSNELTQRSPTDVSEGRKSPYTAPCADDVATSLVDQGYAQLQESQLIPSPSETPLHDAFDRKLEPQELAKCITPEPSQIDDSSCVSSDDEDETGHECLASNEESEDTDGKAYLSANETLSPHFPSRPRFERRKVSNLVHDPPEVESTKFLRQISEKTNESDTDEMTKIEATANKPKCENDARKDEDRTKGEESSNTSAQEKSGKRLSAPPGFSPMDSIRETSPPPGFVEVGTIIKPPKRLSAPPGFQNEQKTEIGKEHLEEGEIKADRDPAPAPVMKPRPVVQHKFVTLSGKTTSQVRPLMSWAAVPAKMVTGRRSWDSATGAAFTQTTASDAKFPGSYPKPLSKPPDVGRVYDMNFPSLAGAGIKTSTAWASGEPKPRLIQSSSEFPWAPASQAKTDRRSWGSVGQRDYSNLLKHDASPTSRLYSASSSESLDFITKESPKRDWKLLHRYRLDSSDVPYVDSHCHIDFLLNRSRYSGSWSSYRDENQDTFMHNYEGCITNFCDPNSYKQIGGRWQSIVAEEQVWAAFGCHPKSVTQYTAEKDLFLRNMMANEKVVALGEIGLDYSSRFGENSEQQKEAFIKQLEIALSYQKPLVIHCRQAEEDCLRIMKQYVPHDWLIHRHCFTDDWNTARPWMDYFTNCFLGLTPLVTYKNAREVHEVAVNVPLNRLLLETDAPYFVPYYVSRSQMAFSTPGMAICVADEVARLRNCDFDNVLLHARQNTRKMYGV